MLARTYRVTDRIGLVILKLSQVFVTAVLQGLHILVGTGRGGLTGIIGLLWGLIAGILSLIFRLVRLFGLVIYRLLIRPIGRLIGFDLGGRNAPVGASALRPAGSMGGIMAQRAARREIETVLVEDPLRIQNRWLSFLTVGLLVALIGVVLWATNPYRAGGGQVVPNPLFQGAAPLGATADPTIAPLLSTPVPTATTLPSVLEVRGSMAYVAREKGQLDIWSLGVGTRTPIRLTNSPFDERDPAWSPDGQRLAYASNQDGNWEIYIYDVQSGASTRMTYDLSFQARPRWSPDGLFLVYESYQGNNLDIYVMKVDQTQAPLRITQNAAPDFSPAWSPDGRRIAFVSWRDGNQDIYIFSLDDPRDEAVTNLTRTTERQEDYPAWSPDGKFLAYSALDEGIEKVFVKSSEQIQLPAQVLGRGRTPAWSPNGASLVFAVDSLEGTQFVASPFTEEGISTLVIGVTDQASSPVWTGRPLPTALVASGGLPSGVPQPLFVEQVASPDRDGLYGLGTLLSVDVARSSPFLSDRVNDSFIAMRQRTLDQVGWDFLGQLDDAFWGLERLPQPGEERRNWYMTGRAFGITRNLIAGFPPQIELVREDIGVETYWRVYVRVAEEAQSGQFGEPLRAMPWDMLSRNSGDVQAYDQGGRLKSAVPEGYYVDFTQIAADYGWSRAAAGTDWRANINAINYWLFEKTGNLDWYAAMRELYTDSQLGGFAATSTPISVSGS
jgi:TolB protein